jgi:hypothetical protein
MEPLHVVTRPPFGNAGLQQNPEQAREIVLGKSPKSDAFAMQDRVSHAR